MYETHGTSIITLFFLHHNFLSALVINGCVILLNIRKNEEKKNKYNLIENRRTYK